MTERPTASASARSDTRTPVVAGVADTCQASIRAAVAARVSRMLVVSTGTPGAARARPPLDVNEGTKIMSVQRRTASSGLVDSRPTSHAPSVLVFDVNETLIDFDSMTPLFEQIFGDPRALREWLGHLFLYSMTTTLSGLYVDFFTLGQGLLQMVAEIHGVRITDEDLHNLMGGMLTMPAHPDVEDGLKALRDNGFRIVSLTNSPPNPMAQAHWSTPGWADFSSISSASTPAAPISPRRRRTTTCASSSMWRHQLA